MQSGNDDNGMIPAGEALLRSLKLNGIDYVFMNPGSDFAPIIESLATADSASMPTPILGLHENVTMGLAHGYYLATGRMQAVAVHVNVGLANTAMGLINARSDDIPVFVLSGRNPLTEGDRPGSRRTPIQYGQEMFDQSGMVRELVKWNYELRYGETVADLVARGCAIARQEPVGAVYLSLPREPLCEVTPPPPATPAQAAPSAPYPDPAAIAAAARLLAEAENPLLICSRGDAGGEVARHIAALAEENSIAVSEVFVTRGVVADDFDHSIGGNVAAHLPCADAVLVVDTPVAWIETLAAPAADAAIIHLGPDPLFGRIPVRGYRNTHAITCNTAAGLAALREAMQKEAGGHVPARQERSARRERIIETHHAYRRTIAAKADAGAKGLANKQFIARVVMEKAAADAVIFSERGGPRSCFAVRAANRWFGNTQAGGLGWALPAALGYKLADRSRQVICMVGDGSFMFANPGACFQVALAEDLPILTVVLNNGAYDAVRLSTLEVYPQGVAAAANRMPMVPFTPNPDYAAIAAASGCHAESVEAAEDFAAALERALAVIAEEGRPAVIDVRVDVEDVANRH